VATLMRTPRDEHIIREGEDWYLQRAVYYDTARTLMPDLSTWTATYVVFPNGDAGLEPVITLTTENGGITLGINGEEQASTTLSGAAAEGATTIALTSATGVSTGDQVAVWLTNGLIFVTAITGLVGTTATLALPLPDPAASSNVVKVYSPEFAITNVLLFVSRTNTSGYEPWGNGRYNLDLIDPFGHVRPVWEDNSRFRRGRDHV
jgi:hypothetical protein